jgi:hypothetical protein
MEPVHAVVLVMGLAALLAGTGWIAARARRARGGTATAASDGGHAPAGQHGAHCDTSAGGDCGGDGGGGGGGD